MSNSDINRRSVLAVATTVPLAAFPLLGEATQSPVIALFNEWQSISTNAHGVSEEECERACYRMSDIEAEMMPLPITDISDLAAKLIVHTADFDFVSSGIHASEFQRQVWAFIEGVA